MSDLITKDEALIARLREEATHDLHHETIALLLEAAQALAAPVGHRDGHWCADLTCKKCYSADFRLKHTTPPAAPAQPAPIPLTDEQLNDLADRCTPRTETGGLRYRDFARAIEAHHGITEKGQP